MPFKLPPDNQIFSNNIIERSVNLIKTGVWSGIELNTLYKWLNNFKSDEEIYFSACALNSLIYRSTLQTKALMEQLLQRVLPDLMRRNPFPSVKNFDFENDLRDAKFDHGIRFVLAVQQSDPGTKSAHAIARHLKREFGVNEQSFIIKPWEIRLGNNSGADTYIFIDDFIGTGTQFDDVMIGENIVRHLTDNYIAYVPLAAHKVGLENISKAHPKVKLSCVESLDEAHSFFSHSSPTFDDGLNTPETAKEYYCELLKDKNIVVGPDERRGYGGLELAYAFEHAVPDNCLPLFWYENNGWEPLFKR